MSDFYVYQYVRTSPSEHGPSGSPYYIGKGRGRRAYRKNSIEIRRPQEDSCIVMLFEGLSEHEAFEMEKQLIKTLGRIDLGTGCLRNRTDGGEGGSGSIKTAAMRAMISAAHKGLKFSEETKARMAKARTGAKHSEETKFRMSALRKGKRGRQWTNEEKAKLSASTRGKVKPEGFKEKISAANRRRVLSSETKAKIAASLTGRKASEETRAKHSKIMKARNLLRRELAVVK